MSSRTNPRGESPSTYFVQDRSNKEELSRLRLQDQMMTTGMGGPLPEQSDPTSLRRMLDVGCATGGWLIETAKAYPSISMLIGVDISERMITFAREQARLEKLDERVQFQPMDALKRLEFPDQFFDLVNQRLADSYLRTWDWPKLLQEYLRVTTPGGIIRISESDFVETNSPTTNRILQLFIQAFHQAGHLFHNDKNGSASELARLMHRYGVENVQTRPYDLEMHSNTKQGQLFIEDLSATFNTVEPFLHKWLRVPENYQELCQRAISEMRKPDFVATWHMLTAWGNKTD